MNKIILKTCGIGVIIGAFIAFCYVGIATDMEQLFDLSTGYIGIKENASIILDYTKWFLPQLSILILWGDYYYQNIIKQYVYVITRSEKCWKLIAGNAKYLLYAAIVFSVSLYIAIFIMGYVNGYKFGLNERIISNMVIYCMHLTLVILYVNCMSMRIKVEYAIITLITLQYLAIVISKVSIANNLGYEKFVLTYQMLFYYKTDYTIYEILIVIILIIITALIVFLIGLRSLTKKDIVNGGITNG